MTPEIGYLASELKNYQICEEKWIVTDIETPKFIWNDANGSFMLPPLHEFGQYEKWESLAVFFFQTSLSHYGTHHKKPKHQLVKMSVFAEICVQSRFSRHYKIQNNISTRNVEYIAPHKLQWIINLLLNVYWFMIETWL